MHQGAQLLCPLRCSNYMQKRPPLPKKDRGRGRLRAQQTISVSACVNGIRDNGRGDFSCAKAMTKRRNYWRVNRNGIAETRGRKERKEERPACRPWICSGSSSWMPGGCLLLPLPPATNPSSDDGSSTPPASSCMPFTTAAAASSSLPTCPRHIRVSFGAVQLRTSWAKTRRSARDT